MDTTGTGRATGDGRLRQAMRTVERWLGAFDYSSFDYTQDRIERLEGQLNDLKSEVSDLRALAGKGG